MAAREDITRSMLQEFLSGADARRALSVFRRLERHDLSRWALAGGLALEIHLLHLGARPATRVLNDVDFVTAAFDGIPETLADDFLLRHIHPLELPGRTMMQLVHAESALRVDVFRASSETMNRTVRLNLSDRTIQLVSLADLAARIARLALDLNEGSPVAVKHATDFLRTASLVDAAGMEPAWQDHRKTQHPATFEQASDLLHTLIPARRDLLITPEYSTNTSEQCDRCLSTPAFQLADPKAVLSVLGYC
jgi:hypothetical protein